MPRRRLRVVLAVVFGLIALGVLAEWATSSPQLCMSCHEIEKRGNSWKESAHSEVECVSCHTGTHEWWQVPQATMGRTRLLAHDVITHLSGDYEDPVDSRPEGFEPIEDSVCLVCHNVNRKATSGFRILIDHAEHAQRNGSCVSCHITVAHPLPERSRAMSLMSQCFKCHGTKQAPEASAECGTCHPADYELLPSSHAGKTWARGHGKVAETDIKQCPMCHERSFCNDCHGLEMPHPAGWEKGDNPQGHTVVAEQGEDVCARCHPGKSNLCSLCHHKDWEPQRGSWIAQHKFMVREHGPVACMQCHAATHCNDCHTKSPGYLSPSGSHL